MTELEKMTAGLQYNCEAEEYQESWKHAAVALEEFNKTSPLADRETAVKAMKELMPNASEAALIIPPLFCDHGWPMHIAERVFINHGCELYLLNKENDKLNQEISELKNQVKEFRSRKIVRLVDKIKNIF